MRIPKRSARACVRELECATKILGATFIPLDTWSALDALGWGDDAFANDAHLRTAYALAASIAGVVDKRGLPV